MKILNYLILIPLLMLTGCATTSKPASVNNLQIQVAQLEKRLNQKEYEIEQLRSDVDQLNRNLSIADSDEYDVSKKEVVKSLNLNFNEDSKEVNDTIIRVPINVKTLQEALAASGFYEGAIDGKIGQGTKQAIRNFQKEHDLNVDGIVGKKTWIELKSYLE